ncbi:unnamed protein product [Nyctereutes procyonoides]|uniref:(raccoon dog) hypothetical protein n=1 Tax=Nyctereutes procyonoides TaxID=34880 RepID=A0A811ZQF6_NYCPR|nr:unnamed protein product [Nyctereutes procyonoides]
MTLYNTSLNCKKMAYQKVNADQRAPGHSQYLDNDDLQATALDLEWDMEKELEEPGFDQFQLDSAEIQNLENPETTDLNLDSIQPATSPKGRFQRLQEESDYVTRYTRSAPKSNPCNFCRLLKILCTAIVLFISGILIGYYAHKKCPSNATSSATLDLQLYQEILETIQAGVIDVSYGNADDLKRIQKMKNTTNQIALLKLGKWPLLYKLSLLEKAGFGGVLLYVDPCDLPKTANLSYEAFMVSLNPGGDPSTPGYPSVDERIVNMQVQTVTKFKTITNVIGYLKGLTSPDRYILVGSQHPAAPSSYGQEWASSTAVITAFIRALMLRVKKGWRPDRTIVFCSWGGTAFGNIGSYEWGEKSHFNCSRKAKCQESNVSSVQIPGDADYFINHLGVPTVEFTYEDVKTLEGPSFLSEALFPKRTAKIEEMDPFFNLHETITKLTGEVILQIANEPVLPFNALDVALEVQNSLKGDQPNTQLLALASRLRESTELFQSDEMRPANDPKERIPIRVRMLNDILQDMEKNFLVQQVPPGFYRNILYHPDEKTSQFAILLGAREHCKLLASNETLQEALSEVLNSINSAQVYFKAGLDVFESVLVGKN